MTDSRKVLVVVAALAIAGVFVVLVATRFGVGVLPDSTVYFDAARNLENGRGFVVTTGTDSELTPLNHYPPLYASLLALAMKGGVTNEAAARWLNAVLFGANIFLVGLALTFCARKSFWLPVLGAFLVLTAPDVLVIHSVALTEPLYLVLTLGGLLSLASYLQNGRRRLLLMAAALIAMSCLTRYVGLATIGAGALALLLLERTEADDVRFAFSFSSGSLRQRVLDTLIFVTLCSLPLALLSIRNRLAAGGASDRHLAFHPVKFQQITSAFSTAAQWLFLGKVRGDFRFTAFIIEILILASLTVFLIRRAPDQGDTKEERSGLPRLLGIFIVAYVSLLLVTVSFFEADNVLDNRSLLPVHFAMLVLGPFVAGRLYSRAPRLGSMRIVLVLLALLLAGSYTLRGARWLALVRADGQGYASRAWKESPAMAEIRKLPAGIPIYTNGVDAVYYLSGRRALDIPPRIIRGTARPNDQYESDLERMKTDMRTHKGVLVYFQAFPERRSLPSESELRIRLPFEIVTLSDGLIFEAQSNRAR